MESGWDKKERSLKVIEDREGQDWIQLLGLAQLGQEEEELGEVGQMGKGLN